MCVELAKIDEFNYMINFVSLISFHFVVRIFDSLRSKLEFCFSYDDSQGLLFPNSRSCSIGRFFLSLGFYCHHEYDFCSCLVAVNCNAPIA